VRLVDREPHHRAFELRCLLPAFVVAHVVPAAGGPAIEASSCTNHPPLPSRASIGIIDNAAPAGKPEGAMGAAATLLEARGRQVFSS